MVAWLTWNDNDSHKTIHKFRGHFTHLNTLESCMSLLQICFRLSRDSSIAILISGNIIGWDFPRLELDVEVDSVGVRDNISSKDINQIDIKDQILVSQQRIWDGVFENQFVSIDFGGSEHMVEKFGGSWIVVVEFSFHSSLLDLGDTVGLLNWLLDGLSSASSQFIEALSELLLASFLAFHKLTHAVHVHADHSEDVLAEGSAQWADTLCCNWSLSLDVGWDMGWNMDWSGVNVIVGDWVWLMDFSGLHVGKKDIGETVIVDRSRIMLRIGGRVMISFTDRIADISAQRNMG